MRVNPASKSPRKPTYAAKQRPMPPPVIQPCFLLGPLSAYHRPNFKKCEFENRNLLLDGSFERYRRCLPVFRNFQNFLGCDFSFFFFWIEVHRSFPALNYSYDGTTESVWFYWEEYRRFKEGIYFFFSRGEWRNRKMFLGFFFVSQTRRIPLNFWILLFRKFENVLLFISRIPKYKNRDKSKIS